MGWLHLRQSTFRLLHDAEEIIGPYVKQGMIITGVSCVMGWF